MSHLIYSTEAVVLKTEDHGEASRLYWLFTEQFGLVLAHAQSVRSGHSKLKHELQLYNFTKVSLVRGREWWRVVNVAHSNLALEKKNPSTSSGRVRFLAEAAEFLLRLIHGEGAHTAIFAALSAQTEILPFKIRSLVELGYLLPDWLAYQSQTASELETAVAAGLAHSQL